MLTKLRDNLQRFLQSRNLIRSKLVSLGLSNSTDKIDVLASTLNGVSDLGNIDATIDGLDVTSYTLPAGYTKGGTVALSDDLSVAEADLVAAIEESGIDVPDGTRWNALADYVRLIDNGIGRLVTYDGYYLVTSDGFRLAVGGE